jgi:hypothetical protein
MNLNFMTKFMATPITIKLIIVVFQFPINFTLDYFFHLLRNKKEIEKEIDKI